MGFRPDCSAYLDPQPGVHRSWPGLADPTDRPRPDPLGWYTLEPIWQGDETDVQRGLPASALSPTWQMFLLGDGSPTRNLQLLTGEAIEVDVIEMLRVGQAADRAPEAIAMVPGPWLRRQVWLRTASGDRLAYAVSWWQESEVDEYLENRSLPIWASLARLRTELYRDVRGACLGRSADLEAAFGVNGPLWSRHYLFWHRGRPLTLIYEVFSPQLDRYLGPISTSPTLLAGH